MSNFVGKLTITVHKATKLRDVEVIGKMDPYVKVTCYPTVLKTRVHQDGGRDPVWEQSFVLNLAGTENDRISFQVFDDDIGKDERIGFVDILISELVSKPQAAWYRLHSKEDGDNDGGLLSLSTSFQGTLPQQLKFPEYIVQNAAAPPPAQVGVLAEPPKPVVVPPAVANAPRAPESLGQYLVNNLFKHVLGRAPNPTENVYHASRVDSGKIRPEGLLLEFLNCGEFTAKGRGNAETLPADQFVTILCEVALSRAPAASDINNHTPRINNHSITRAALAAEFLNCGEFHAQFQRAVQPVHRVHEVVRTRGQYLVYNLLDRMFGRPHRPDELNNHAARLDTGKMKPVDMFWEFVNCGEFQAKGLGTTDTMSTENYLRCLYRAALGREPGPDAANHTNRLNGGQISRRDLAAEFFNCAEAKDRMRVAIGYYGY